MQAATTALSRNEIQALVNKYRTNTFGRYSPALILGLVARGLVDAETRRLTEDGIAIVEIRRRGG